MCYAVLRKNIAQALLGIAASAQSRPAPQECHTAMGIRPVAPHHSEFLRTTMERQAIEQRAAKFFDVITDEFGFLETDYGFTCEHLELKDLEYPQDARASVPFTGDSVGLEVVLGFGDDSISVIFYELDHGSRPARLSFYPGADDGARAVRLDTVIRILAGAEYPFPLPEITPGLSVAEMIRRGEERSQLLQRDLRGVVSAFANLVQEYASQILRGDTTRFSEFQAHHSDFWRWT